MTRILFWNIENFGVNKINNPSNKRKRGASIRDSVASADRRTHILNVINSVNPDIFILVENETAWTGRGSLVSGAGSVAGPIALLGFIRGATGNPHWMLIPPLQTGSSEAVAVFYNSMTLTFSGPNTWSGGAGGISQLPGVGVPAAYPLNFGNGMPAVGNTIPAGSLYNAGLEQRLAAARVNFTYAAHMVGLAGAPYVYGTTRSPYMTTFYDGANVRNITVFSIHSPASYPLARAYLTHLTQLAEIRDGLVANEVRVIAGDFNVNLLADAHPFNQSAAYNIPNYILALTPPAVPPAPGAVNGYKGFFATHIKPTKHATYQTTNTQTQYFPGYGYIGSELVKNFYAIDNILTHYGGAAGGPAGNFTIMNTISSSPFNAFGYPLPVAGTPVGNIATPSQMTMFGGANPPAQAPAFQAGMLKRFRGWNNYGRIRSVSDHFALAIDV